MKHIVEIKLPKLFGSKKKVEEPEVVTEEVNVEDVIKETIADTKTKIEETIEETKSKIEETNNNIKDTLKYIAPFAATLAVGYVAGFNRGLMKGIIREASEKIIVINK